MITVIAGSRSIEDYSILLTAINRCPFVVTEVVSGRARGVDTLGERYAKENGLPLHLFPADWKKFGNRAGPIRNGQMADFAEAVICVWDGLSTGTKNMIKQATDRGLHVYVYRTDQESNDLLEFVQS